MDLSSSLPLDRCPLSPKPTTNHPCVVVRPENALQPNDISQIHSLAHKKATLTLNQLMWRCAHSSLTLIWVGFTISASACIPHLVWSLRSKYVQTQINHKGSECIMRCPHLVDQCQGHGIVFAHQEHGLVVVQDTTHPPTHWHENLSKRNGGSMTKNQIVHIHRGQWAQKSIPALSKRIGGPRIWQIYCPSIAILALVSSRGSTFSKMYPKRVDWYLNQ